MKRLKNFINGKFVDSTSDEVLDIVYPVTGEVIAQAPISTDDDVNTAMHAAQDAFKTWKHTTPSDRQLLLLKLADAFEENVDVLVEAQPATPVSPENSSVTKKSSSAPTSYASSQGQHAP